jgi:hypothetical protein
MSRSDGNKRNIPSLLVSEMNPLYYNSQTFYQYEVKINNYCPVCHQRSEEKSARSALRDRFVQTAD